MLDKNVDKETSGIVKSKVIRMSQSTVTERDRAHCPAPKKGTDYQCDIVSSQIPQGRLC